MRKLHSTRIYHFYFLSLSVSSLEPYLTNSITFFSGLLEDKADKMIGDPLFVREYGRTASYYANRTFAPIWRKTPQDIIPPNRYSSQLFTFRNKNFPVQSLKFTIDPSSLIYRTKDIQTAESLCSDCYQCKYDYSVSLDKEMARTTLNFYSSYSKIKLLNKRRGKKFKLQIFIL